MTLTLGGRVAIIDMLKGGLMRVEELFERNDVTDVEWAGALAVIEAEESKQWAEFLERQQNFDDAVYSNPWVSKLRSYVGNKGCGFIYQLADLQGNLVKSKMVDGKFGKVWLVEKQDGSVEWVNVSSAEKFSRQQAHYNKKGYQLVQCTVRIRLNKQGEPYHNLDEVIEVEMLKDEEV